LECLPDTRVMFNELYYFLRPTFYFSDGSGLILCLIGSILRAAIRSHYDDGILMKGYAANPNFWSTLIRVRM